MTEEELERRKQLVSDLREEIWQEMITFRGWAKFNLTEEESIHRIFLAQNTANKFLEVLDEIRDFIIQDEVD